MRTTITLEPDVAAELARRRAESNRSFKEEVNALLRAGLERERETPEQREPWTMPTWDGGGLLIDVTSYSAAMEQLEGPGWK